MKSRAPDHDGRSAALLQGSVSEFRPLRAGLLLALLLALYTLAFIDRIILSLLIEPLKSDLQLSDVQVSLLIGAAFSIFYATVGLPLGYVADRWNRRNLIAIGVAFWSLMTAAGSVAQGFISLFITRMGVGLGEAALSPAAYSLLGDSYPQRLVGRAMSIYAIGVPLGSGLALVLGGMVVGWLASAPEIVVPYMGVVASWRVVLVVVGLPGLVLGALMLLTREPARQSALLQPESSGVHREGLVNFVLRNRRYLLPMLFGLAFMSAAHYAMFVWTPSLFVREFGMVASQAAVPMGVLTAIGGVVGMLTGGTLGDKLFARGIPHAYALVFLSSALCAAPFFILFPIMPKPWLTMLFLSGAGFFVMIQAGLPAASLRLIAPSHLRAQLVAVFILVQGLVGAGLGPTIVALCSKYVFDESQLGYSMSLSALLLMIPSCALLSTTPRSLRALVANDIIRHGG